MELLHCDRLHVLILGNNIVSRLKRSEVLSIRKVVLMSAELKISGSNL